MTDTYRVRFVIDEDARFEECNGEPRPLTEDEYKGNEYYKDGKPTSYADYRAYYGNPERHVYLGCEVQRKCPTCGHWENVASLWNIDFMDDSPELRTMNVGQWYTPAQAFALPGLADIAKEELTEAGFTQ